MTIGPQCIQTAVSLHRITRTLWFSSHQKSFVTESNFQLVPSENNSCEKSILTGWVYQASPYMLPNILDVALYGT